MRDVSRSAAPVSGRVLSVVLTRRSAGALSDLRRATGDGGDATIAREPLEAMASLALLVRGNTSRAAWGLPAAGSVRLVIDAELRGVSVDLDRDLDEMIAGIETWLPEARCEWWDPAADPPPAAEATAPPTNGASVRSAPDGRALDQPSSMNMADDSPDRGGDDADGGEVEVESLEPDESDESPVDDGDGPRPAVTRDELTMLLDERDVTSRRPS